MPWIDTKTMLFRELAIGETFRCEHTSFLHIKFSDDQISSSIIVHRLAYVPDAPEPGFKPAPPPEPTESACPRCGGQIGLEAHGIVVKKWAASMPPLEPELLPCPFCECLTSISVRIPKTDRWFRQCEGCGATDNTQAEWEQHQREESAWNLNQ